MILLNDISHRFSGTLVLNGVSLDVPASATVALIGPSGCGKSTLLRIVAGLIQPDCGAVKVNGQSVTPGTITAIRDRLGYVIQDGGLFPHLTARENVTIRARLARWEQSQLGERLTELAELTRFPMDAMDRYPAELSGGQRQRIGIMRALMMDPDVLLLDEPLAALDPMVRRELQDDLRDIFRRLRKTVLMVTHDLHEAAWFADQVVLMNVGQIVQAGSVQQMANHPENEFVSRFVNAQRTTLFGVTS